MPFVLLRRVLGTRSEFAIDAARFADIRTARNASSSLLATEEKLELLLTCYSEFEEVLLHLAIGHVIHDHGGWSASIDEIQTVNHRLIALLAMGRLYTEQVQHDIHSIYGRRGVPTNALSTKIDETRQEDSSFAFVEAIRNYVQHRSLPVHRLISHAAWEGEGADRRCVHTVDAELEVAKLEGDRRFDRETLEAMADRNGRINLRPLVRSYVSAIGRIHQLVREASEADINVWDAAIRSAEEDFAATFNEGITGLAAVHKNDAGETIEIVPIFSDPIQRRETLKQKNRNVSHLSHQIVSSASRADV